MYNRLVGTFFLRRRQMSFMDAMANVMGDTAPMLGKKKKKGFPMPGGESMPPKSKGKGKPMPKSKSKGKQMPKGKGKPMSKGKAKAKPKGKKPFSPKNSK